MLAHQMRWCKAGLANSGGWQDAEGRQNASTALGLRRLRRTRPWALPLARRRRSLSCARRRRRVSSRHLLPGSRTPQTP